MRLDELSVRLSEGKGVSLKSLLGDSSIVSL